MSPTYVLLFTLSVVVLAHARFIPGPIIHPIVPIPLIRPIPFVRPFIHAFHHPVLPMIRESSSRVTSHLTHRPASTPFVMEQPRVFPREDEPIYINFVDNRDPRRDVVIIENKQPVIERPRYIEDTGDISIDGNVYISDPYATNDMKRGASVEQVVSRSVGAGQLTRGDSIFNNVGEMDYPLPVPNVSLNVQGSPSLLEPIIDRQTVTMF